MSLLRPRLLLVVSALVLASAVWLTATVQRATATRAVDRMQVAEARLNAMLDQETGLRGFLLTGHEAFLEPYVHGRDSFASGQRRLHAFESDDRDELVLVRRGDELERRWQALAASAIADTRRRGVRRDDVRVAFERKGLMDRFRVVNAQLRASLERERVRDGRRAALLSLGISLAVLLAVGGVGTILASRRQRAEARRERREERYRVTQAEFAEALQAVQSEEEAHALLKRHLERSQEGRDAAVLSRNNSANRLELRTHLAESDELVDRLVGAEPRSCVAVRLGRAHEERPGEHPLLGCAVCGGLSETVCSPLLVSGKVIGSVLVRQAEAFDAGDRRRLCDTVAQAAPVLANLRTIAIAESRAATDALTGLPNRRAVNDTLKRLVAQAGRTGTSLAALAIDLDRFKQVNDRFGHDKGDEVLATVAGVLAGSVRESDFVGRLGGEEFLILAPDTPRQGAVVLAEHVRAAVERVEVRGVEGGVSASVGVAAHPEHAPDGESLLRRADRALYVAKAQGRNRVEAAPAREPVADPAPLG